MRTRSQARLVVLLNDDELSIVLSHLGVHDLTRAKTVCQRVCSRARAVLMTSPIYASRREAAKARIKYAVSYHAADEEAHRISRVLRANFHRDPAASLCKTGAAMP